MKNRILSTISAIAISCTAVTALSPITVNAETQNAAIEVVNTTKSHTDLYDAEWSLYNNGTVKAVIKATGDIDPMKDDYYLPDNTLTYDKGLYALKVGKAADCLLTYTPFTDNIKGSIMFPIHQDDADEFDTTTKLQLDIPNAFFPILKKGDTVLELEFDLIGEITEPIDIYGGLGGITVNPENITIKADTNADNIVYTKTADISGIICEVDVHESGIIDVIAYNASNCFNKYPDQETHNGMYDIDATLGFTVPDGYTVEYDFAKTADSMELEKEDADYIIKSDCPSAEIGAYFWAKLTPEEEREYKDISLLGVDISGEMLEHINLCSNIVVGDATCDGEVGLADSLAILQYIANSSKYPLTKQGQLNADCTSVVSLKSAGDGITGSDSLAIQLLDAGEISELPIK